ncbi:hypothetical protein REPUB_Repub18cG0120300 [Reevesia pubescens]
MVVRGAPAIAIAAAFSLAVEVANLKDFNGTSGDAASFLEMKLEYLVSSLATAGYGTALGVIRALHAEGVLERVYCTETRPFNQGSRLTAFGLVHEKIPATLIADSAAAALMKEGRVSAVIVGVDRVAANALTSIDLSPSCGEEIVIEEISAKELLHSHGGLG